MDDVLKATALEQARLVRAGQLTARELVEAALGEAERVQAELGAFTLIDGERALAAADAVEPGDPRPFAGVPYAPKDLALPCADFPLTNGSALFGDYRPGYDAVSMARARGAGLIPIGQTVSAEMGMLPVTDTERYGSVRNPFDRDLTAGGSSGGAGAAVGGGALAIASGSDAGGSIRVPAACCGLVGLKPTRGRVTLGPDMGDHPLAVEGCLTRDVADTAAFLDAVAGPSPGDPVFPGAPERPFAESFGDRRRLRIGICTEPQFAGPTDPERIAAVEVTAKRLADAGHELEPIAPNPWPAESIESQFVDLFAAGVAGFVAFGEMVGARPAGPETLEPLTWAMTERGQGLSALAVGQAQVMLHGWSLSVDTAIDRFDAVLGPVLPSKPLPIGAIAEHGGDFDAGVAAALRFVAYTVVANITGRPALSMPVGHDDAGLPLAVQLLGRVGDEATLLALGSELERSA